MKPKGHHTQGSNIDSGDETSVAHRTRFAGIRAALKGKFQAPPSRNPHDPAYKMHQARRVLARLPFLHPSAQLQVEIDYKKEFKALRGKL